MTHRPLTALLSFSGIAGVLLVAACSSDAGSDSNGSPLAGAAGSLPSAAGASGAAQGGSNSAAGSGTVNGGASSSGGGADSGGTTAAGGSSGGSSAGGGSLAGGSATGGDTPPWREMMTDTKGFRNNAFSAREADPTVSDPKSHPDDKQRAGVNTSKPLKKKLCVVLPGIGNGPGQGIGDWAAQQGYHVLQIAYSNALDSAGKDDTNPDTPGNTRMNQFDGKGRTPSNATILRQDSIEQRTIKALEYLKLKDPGGDWGWFLNQDGSMRWSDGCFIGYSYGATHLAIIARYVRIGLGVSASGPQAEGHADASWLEQPSATPVERMFAIYGSQDGPDKYNSTTEALGYGPLLVTTANAAPGTPAYMGAHRIQVDGLGHTEFCAGNPPQYCNYMFGLPPFGTTP